ncbi:hypothetical protein F652_34 [Enterobacteriaceae bacterium bta3-1]|nr:hypothetical protein F652_34 [Enterobacteriaceae bacterium bta3-1]
MITLYTISDKFEPLTLPNYLPKVALRIKEGVLAPSKGLRIVISEQ